jgi:CheY-like chemotaxis protein
VLVDGGGKEVEKVRAALAAAGHAVERVRTPQEAVELTRDEELVRAHRVESLSALAGGIAHDLNNVLASGLMAVDLLAGSSPAPPAARLLAALEESFRRATGLVRQLLWFARGAESGDTLFEPRHLIGDLQKVMAALLPPGSELETAYPPDLRFLAADPLQVYELLFGLLRAGWTALPPAGGTLTLAARDADVDAAFAHMLPGARAGSYVSFAVSPAPPQGLPAALQALLGALGGVAAPSGPDEELRVYLPASEVPEHAPTTPGEVESGRGERILLAEADPVLRELLAAALERAGYRPLTAADGSQAVALFTVHAEELAAVVAARDLEWLDGPATLHAVAHLRPRVGTLLLESEPPGGVAEPPLPTLRKPFTAAELLAALRQLL